MLTVSTDAQSEERLFEIVETARIVPAIERTSLASKREAEIDFDRVTVASISSSARIEIPLFDGKTVVADRRGVEIRSLDDVTWRGKIVRGSFSGDIILTFRKGFVSGLIYSPDSVYEIVAKGDKQILIELDQSAFPECGGEVKSETPPTTESPELTIDSGDRIDVLVVYTTATKNFLGGDAQAQTLAQQAIDATNTAYINSRISQRVRMVKASEYFYTETASASTDLSNLRSNATIQALRETHKADLVAMIGEIQGACGIGYLMGSASGGNANNAFTATARSCAVGNLSFAHELGHNMGSHHNPENGGTATFPYSYGHYVNGFYRTVMSYVNPCTSGCTRHPYFSNPRVTFMGFPTGLDNARDNARSINGTANPIANYRYSGSSLTLTNFHSAEMIPRMIGRDLLWWSDNLTGNVRIETSRDEGNTWQTFLANTPNDGVQRLSIGGRATKRFRLRIVSLGDTAVTDSSVTNLAIR